MRQWAATPVLRVNRCERSLDGNTTSEHARASAHSVLANNDVLSQILSHVHCCADYGRLFYLTSPFMTRMVTRALRDLRCEGCPFCITTGALIFNDLIRATRAHLQYLSVLNEVKTQQWAQQPARSTLTHHRTPLADTKQFTLCSYPQLASLGWLAYEWHASKPFEIHAPLLHTLKLNLPDKTLSEMLDSCTTLDGNVISIWKPLAHLTSLTRLKWTSCATFSVVDDFKRKVVLF